MTTAIEYYSLNDDEDYAQDVATTDWVAQTFTLGTTGTNVASEISSVYVKISNLGGGSVYAKIREVNPAGAPVGSDLSTGEALTSTFDDDWGKITMTALTLQPSKKYALILTAAFTCTARADGTAPAYTGGTVWYSADSGDSWTEDATTDIMFQINGADDEGTLCTSGEAIAKAGAGASSDAKNPILVTKFIIQAESRLNVITKKDWVTAYSGLDTNVKNILNEVISNMAAIYMVNYDDSGYTSGLEYERKIAILKAEVRELVRELKDLELKEWMSGI